MAVTLDENIKMFVIYIATLVVAPVMQVYPSHQVQVGLLLTDKAFVKV